MSAPETHRGWLIEQNWLGWWEATHPEYDGPEDGRCFVEPTREELLREIELWFEESNE